MGWRDRGTATAELAVVLPALVLVAALCAWLVMAAAGHLRCLDAARSAARELTRGEDVEVVRDLAHRRAPEGATVRFFATGEGLVAAEVRARVGLPLAGDLVGVTVGGSAVAAAEGVDGRGGGS